MTVLGLNLTLVNTFTRTLSLNLVSLDGRYELSAIFYVVLLDFNLFDGSKRYFVSE